MARIARLKSKLNIYDLMNFNITLLAMVGITQASELFSDLMWFSDFIKYLILLISILILFLQCIERKVLIGSGLIIFGIITVLAYTCVQTRNYSFLLICLFLITGRATTIENFLKRSLDILILFGGGHIFLWLINYFIPFGMTVYTNEAEKRIAFGFSHPNICAIKFGWGILMYLWLNWDKMTKKKWIFLYVLSAVFYMATKSDSWLIVFAILIIAEFKKIKIVRKIVAGFAYITFPLFGVLNIWMGINFLSKGYLSSLFATLDYVFNRRVSMAYLAIKENGMTWLGQKIEMIHEWDSVFNYNGYTIDSAYIYFYVCIGVVYLILISIGFFMLRKYHDYRVTLIILAFSLYSLIEIHSIYLTNSFALLLLKAVIFKEKQIE